jgi:hypothetical protein
MKKSLLSFVFVLAFATMASAAPRFGVIGEQNAGIGAFITDDMYNAQLTFGSNSDDATPKTEGTTIKFGGNYKIALDSMTALTAGVSYTMVSGKDGFGEIDTNNTLAIVAGFERALSSNIVLTADIDLYSQQTEKYKGSTSERKTTRLFETTSFGIAYLF